MRPLDARCPARGDATPVIEGQPQALVLVSGTKRPYDSWTFVVVPDPVVPTLGSKRAMEGDPEPRPVDIPSELQEVLATDPDLSRRFEGLPPAHRRAWAAYVGEAKRAQTRTRRAAKAPDGIRGKSFPGT